MRTKLYLAFFCVAFFWGTTFLGIKIGVETIPPFILAGIRNFISGFIIITYLFYQKRLEKISIHQFARAFLLSMLMIVLANGLTTYAEKYISSGLASLISTLNPLFVLLINLFLGYEKLSFKTILGIFFGMLGMFLLYQSRIEELLVPEYRFGILAIFIAIISWSIGTIITKKGSTKTLSMLMNVSLQMIIAGVVLTSIQFTLTPNITYETWSTRSILAMIYLALFGSVVGYVAFSYLLSQISSTKVTVLSYANVVVALFLGWLLLDEIITLRIILATLFIISGVFIVNYKRKKLRSDL
ncbi:MAG: EamA family transporter [Flavobacterium sp.]|uniref:DMT family transporter n=1 Tax=Flavobacterium sp. TaxID=239 RepID=UPI003528AFAF